MKAPLTWIGVGVLIGASVLYVFFWPSLEEREETTKKTEIVYVDVEETINFDSISNHVQSLSDSIDFYRKLYAKELKKESITIIEEGEPIQAPLRRYTGFKPTLYGNISYSSLVIGKQLEMTIKQDLKVPIITNTINTKKTIVLNPGGLYAGGGVSSDLGYKVGASYVDKSWQFNYDYEFKQDSRPDIHWVGVKKRIF